MPPAGAPFRLLGVRHLERGRLLQMQRRWYWSLEGRPMVREMVRHPGSVAVLPALDTEVVLVRQPRTAIGDALVEIPAGLRDLLDEEPISTARRECEEETGFRPHRMTLLHRFYNSPGFTDEHTWLYLAEELEQIDRRPQGAEERMSEVVRLPWEEAFRMGREGAIQDAKTVLALYALGFERGWL
ncbi:MAG: NUDIX hydrolase [Actinomycetota bacterium]|nr:NUDIX hydrolase [Actinomycetota bacterium]